MRIYDISTPIMNKAMEPQSSKISYVGYKMGARLLGLEGLTYKNNKTKTWLNYLMFLLGVKRISPSSFPNGLGLSWENIHTMSHRGTHVDAPSHFGPICEGQVSKTCSELPLEWFFQDGVILDMSFKKQGEIISIDDIKTELRRIKYTLKPFDIVLIRTDMDKKWESPSYLQDAPGVSVEAIEWLILQGIKVIGIDSYSLDLPASIMVELYLKDKDKKHLWPAHILGRKYEYCHIEKLANLDTLPTQTGFKVIAFPVHIKDASAGWCRAIAMFE